MPASLPPGYDPRADLDALRRLCIQTATIRDRFEKGSPGFVRWDRHFRRLCEIGRWRQRCRGGKDSGTLGAGADPNLTQPEAPPERE